ncbi:MAG: TldD/PmbA family protein [Acidobacteria bacterium]|nr:TldD/PmbA family protein [Acidobacteriota bacterium]
MSTTMKQTDDMLSIARSCIEIAKKGGATEASAAAYRVRNVDFQWRDGKPEKVEESTTRGVQLAVFADQRYAVVSTSDLRREALETFIGDAVDLAKSLAKDPFRSLPDPELYKGQSTVDLGLEDPKYDTVTPELRQRIAKEAETAARAVKGNEAILSVTSNVSDTLTERFLVSSNGFAGKRRDTSFFVSAQVSVKDKDGRRPEDYSYAGARHFAEVPGGAVIGREAGERTIARLGAKKGESAEMTMVIDNRASGRMLGFLMGPLSGASIQQKRSFLEGQLGKQVFSDKITIVDDPFIPKAFGSRLFDAEGISAKTRPVVEAGVLKSYYIDSYYGRKLGVAPTSGSASNLRWTLGDKNRDALVAGLQDGILVTSFLGGNSNGLTGDFSLGVQGFRIRGGKLAEPVGEMNISGNHLVFWKQLAAVGNDPFPYSALRTPTLVFDGVSFAGV